MRLNQRQAVSTLKCLESCLEKEHFIRGDRERIPPLPNTLRVFLFKALFIAFIACASLYGQPGGSGSVSPQAADSGQKTPSIKITTRLVIVDLVAHDKKGNVVTDLEVPDIRVLEDGKEQPVSSFAFQRPLKAAERAEEKDQAALPANIVSSVRKLPPNTALNVILLDSLNSNLLNQAYVRIEMVKFLEKLPQGQPVAVFTLGKKLHLVQDFTTDLTALKRVIAAFKGESLPLMQNPTGTSEVSMVPQGLAAQALVDKTPQLMMQIKEFAEESTADQNDVRIQYTFAALTSLGKTLSRYKGRKNLIWVSESIPMNIYAEVGTHAPVSASFGQVAERNNGRNHDRAYGDQLAYLANLLTDAQVAVYPIDARGLIGSPLYNVASNISGQGGSALGGLAMKAEGKQSEELFQSHAAMLDIADKTGGKAYYNRNDIDNALRDGIEDGSTYYMVGYYPQNKTWDGRFRKIEVKSRRPGIKLRYRTGYFAVDRAAYLAGHPEQNDLDFSQALSLESPAANTLQFEAHVNVPQGDSTTVLLNYAIDSDDIQFTPGPDGLQHAQVDCAVRAYSRKDLEKPVKTEATKVDAALKADVFAKVKASFFPCELKIDLPAGQYVLRLAVRDSNGSTLGSGNAQVTIPAQPVTARHKTDTPH
jgi:VWFA-related protein